MVGLNDQIVLENFFATQPIFLFLIEMEVVLTVTLFGYLFKNMDQYKDIKSVLLPAMLILTLFAGFAFQQSITKADQVVSKLIPLDVPSKAGILIAAEKAAIATGIEPTLRERESLDIKTRRDQVLTEEKSIWDSALLDRSNYLQELKPIKASRELYKWFIFIVKKIRENKNKLSRTEQVMVEQAVKVPEAMRVLQRVVVNANNFGLEKADRVEFGLASLISSYEAVISKNNEKNTINDEVTLTAATPNAITTEGASLNPRQALWQKHEQNGGGIKEAIHTDRPEGSFTALCTD
jgi:hypothetical protein